MEEKVLAERRSLVKGLAEKAMEKQPVKATRAAVGTVAKLAINPRSAEDQRIIPA